jgi:hypothetical protein
VKDTSPKSKTAVFWQKAQYANLIRHVPSGIYFAGIRMKGKLIRKSLKTDVLSVAKLRLSDFEKSEHPNELVREFTVPVEPMHLNQPILASPPPMAHKYP